MSTRVWSTSEKVIIFVFFVPYPQLGDRAGGKITIFA